MQSDVSKNYQNQPSAIRENNDKALKLLYQSNYPKVEKYVLENNGTVDEAKDIFQEAFVAVWRSIQLGKLQLHHETSLSGYLYKVAKYKWIDQLRRNKNQKYLMAAADEAPFLLEKEEQDYLEQVKVHYETMGEPCKDLLYRFYFLKQRMSEIAVVFSWTEPTARNNKYRCLQKLRNMVLSKSKSVEIRK